MLLNFKILPIKLLFRIFISFSALQSLMAFELDPFPVMKLKTEPKNIFQLQQNISLVGKNDFVTILRAFVSSGTKGRMVGTAGHREAVGFLKDAISKLSNKQGIQSIDGFEPQVELAIKEIEESFQKKIEPHHKKTSADYEKARRYKESFVSYIKKNRDEMGRNIIWEKKGSLFPNEMLILVAHYDTLGVNDQDKVDSSVSSPGADDNGSGVAIALQCLQLFSRMNIPRTLRIVFLDWEEFGRLGSHAFVKKYQQEFSQKKVIGFINLEMLGHDSRFKDSEKKHYNLKTYYRRPGSPNFEKEKSFVEAFLARGKKGDVRPKFTPIGNSYPHSGALHLWDEALIGTTLSQNWEEDFNKGRNHTSNDFVETLNLKTLFSVFKFVASGVGATLFALEP